MEKEQIEKPGEAPFFARFLEGQRREVEDPTTAERTRKFPSDNDEDFCSWF